jgi:Berberine and berberine like
MSKSAVEKAKNWKFFSQFITEPYPAEAIDIVGKFMKNAPSEVSDYFCSSLGAVKKAPPGGSAFAHRDALFYAEPGAGWGSHYARLREIKAKYDPDNVFQYEQSIPSA